MVGDREFLEWNFELQRNELVDLSAALEGTGSRSLEVEPVVQSLDQVESVELQWLWDGIIPAAKLSLLTGDPGEGKSLVLCDLIARLTSGREAPGDDEEGGPYDVLLLVPRLDVSTLRPRLEAAGADLSRIELLQEVRQTRSGDVRWMHRTPDLTRSIRALEICLERNQNIELVAIDPLTAFAGEVDHLQSGAVRAMFQELSELAERTGATIVCVEPFESKLKLLSSDTRDFSGHYRTVWGVVRDPRDIERRLFLPIRNSLGNDRNGRSFSLEPGGDHPGLVWSPEVETISWAEASGRVRGGRGIWSFSQTAAAEAWLREFLKDGEQPSIEIFASARERGLTEHPLRIALRRIAYKYKQGVDGPWFWKLDQKE